MFSLHKDLENLIFLLFFFIYGMLYFTIRQ